MKNIEFKILVYCNNFVNYNLLDKGIYTTSVPHIFSKDTTIEDLIRQAKMTTDSMGNYFISEKYFENLKKCSLKTVILTETKN